MENQPAEPNPAPESPDLSAVPAAPQDSDALLLLAQAAKAARLSPADEERATALLQERLTQGKAGITAAIAPMIDGLPWIVCVNAVSAVWEKLSVPMRRHLLGSIAKSEAESARRLRLSLARALFKLEPAAGLKLAAAAAADLRHPETGALSAKYRQFFFNIFIGKGKPWLLQLPLADLKAAEADALVHGALECFPFCPPLSQLSILRWANEAGRLKKASAADWELAAKGVSRWNIKLQRQLKSEIADLPAPLEAALKPEAHQPEPPAKAEPSKRPESKKSQRSAPAAPEVPEEKAQAEPAAPVEELVIPGRAERLAKKAEEKLKRSEPERRKAERSEERPERAERSERTARPFDVKEALRGVESYIGSLRSELEQTKTQLNRQSQEGKRGGRSARVKEELPSAELEALTRHNLRLETTVAELRAQLEDLAAHHETVAESRQLHTGEPLPEGEEQLKALLAIQLQESYQIYEAMRLEPLDRVFRLDYRDLLGSVFETLTNAGIALKRG